MDYRLIFPILALLLAAWFASRYYKLRRAVDEFAARARKREITAGIKELENLSSAVASLITTFDTQHAALESERARLAAALEQLTDGVLIADPAGVVRFANPAAEKILGGNLPGRSVAEALRHHQLIQAWQRCSENGELQSESVEIPARKQFLQIIVIPDRHGGGSLLLLQDLTRIRRLETVRRDFISNVSHELRTPLASLKALTETLQNGALADPEAAPRFLGRIATEVDALTQMAQELLDLSRIESGQVELKRAPLSPKSLLISAADRMKMQAERAGLKLSILCDDDLPHIHADQSRLEQVLVNLIHNSVKFTKPGGEILLLAESDSGGVRFAVKDSGVGIPSDDLSRIFERFYKSDRSRAGGGTGLGLSIARHIVEAHAGRIWAESEEGRGSAFFFSIPQS